jgi:hypothetical protein
MPYLLLINIVTIVLSMASPHWWNFPVVAFCWFVVGVEFAAKRRLR